MAAVAVNLRTVSSNMLLLLTSILAAASAATTNQPNIVLIVADDLGFNDMGFRGSIDFPTPNIDALAYAGRILDRHYVLPTCTPSRTALLTGKYPVRTGMQGYPLKAGEKRALPSQFTLLPEYLKKLNYSTHLIGKWHQGFYHWNYTPTYRGFDSFIGYYNGYIGYFTHDITMSGYKPKAAGEVPANGVDMHRDKTIALDVNGIYATELFTRETEKIIRSHDKKKPLFIDLSHLAVHTGKDGKIVEVEDEAANNKTFGFIKEPQRRRLAGAMASLDKSVGRVVNALADNDMIENTIILFIADNGGETKGIHSNAASNYPLRGQKFTQLEGGVRGAGVVWHSEMKPTEELYSDYVHITDWIPTLYEAAGGNLADLEVDGVSQWKKLLGKETQSPRTELLVNSEFLVDDRGINATVHARSYIDGPWKLIWGLLYPSMSDFMGEAGNTQGAKPYDLDGVVNSKTMETLLTASKLGKGGLNVRARRLRSLATLPKDCRKDAPKQQSTYSTCKDGCLFNIREDPCETRDVSAEHPDIAAFLKSKLEYWKGRTVPQLNTFVDPESDPRHFGRTWLPWKDVKTLRSELSEPIGDSTSDASSFSADVFEYLENLWCKFI